MTYIALVMTALAFLALGGWSSEVRARDAYLNGVGELVRKAVIEALEGLKADTLEQTEAAIVKWFGAPRVESEDGDEPMLIAEVPVEQRVAQELTEASVEEIRQGLIGEYGLSGKELALAMDEVRKQYGLTGDQL